MTGWERAAQFFHLCQQPPGMPDCSHCGGEPCLSARPLALSHYCRQSSCRSLVTPPTPTLTPPGHFNCNPQLKVFIKFSLSPASSSVRSAACRPDRRSSEEHLQFKRDAYATAVSGLKVNRLLRHDTQDRLCLAGRLVSFTSHCLELCPSCQASRPTAARLARRRSELAGAALAQRPPASVRGPPQANNRVLPSASHRQAQGEDDCNSCSAGSLLTNGPVTLLID